MLVHEPISRAKLATMSPHVIRITPPLELGEGPHWDSNTKSLYFVNMLQSEIHRYEPHSNLHTHATVESIFSEKKPVTFVIPVQNQPEKFIIGYGGELATVEWNGVSNSTKNFQPISILEPAYPKVRLNDAKVSPGGVLFAGSMGVERPDHDYPHYDGNLFAFNGDDSKVILKKIGISNGLAWSADERTFYYIDSLTCKVVAYDYNPKALSISNERTIFDFLQSNIANPVSVIPDGMTIDNAGNLWVAVIGSSKVFQINTKTKTMMSSIEFPCTQPTSVTFGGPNLEDLYVTTAFLHLTEEERQEKPDSGCLFKVKGLGVKGYPGKSLKLVD